MEKEIKPIETTEEILVRVRNKAFERMLAENPDFNIDTNYLDRSRLIDAIAVYFHKEMTQPKKVFSKKDFQDLLAPALMPLTLELIQETWKTIAQAVVVMNKLKTTINENAYTDRMDERQFHKECDSLIDEATKLLLNVRPQ